MMKISISLFLALFFLLGCVYHQMDTRSMIKDMKHIQKTDRHVHINILWYIGTDSEFHYFGYVYSMTGRKDYKVLKNEITIAKEIELTDDSSKWVLIRKIDDMWSSSRKYSNVWEEDKEGINIKYNVQ